MTMNTPRWLPWLCPVAAVAGGLLLSPLLTDGGFWTTFLIAAACSFVPLAAHRLWMRFRRQT